jgi:hypothetical protein
MKDKPTLELVEQFQDALVAFSTGSGGFGGAGLDYKAERERLLDLAESTGLLPPFVRRYRDLDSYWQFIKRKFGTYAERREFLWESFRPLLEHLETAAHSPASRPVELLLSNLNGEVVNGLWRKALERRTADPEGAITAARALLESVCKHILDELQTEYPSDADPAKLWALCAEELNLSPDAHSEKVFKSILGNCQSIVNNLASIRNKIGDAHGQGRKAVRAKPRHAELAVNLAGTMASFLVATWMARTKE